MAHVPVNDVNELWQDVPSKSWKGLEQTLEEHKEKAEGINNNLIPELMDIVKKHESSPFPNSTQKLYDVFNQG